MAEVKMKSLAELSHAEKEALIAKPITECSQVEKDLKLAILDERVRGIVSAQDLSKVGPDDPVWVTVPLKDDGEMFEINLKKYYGRIEVTKRTAETLMYMISDHFGRVRERTTDRGNVNRRQRDGMIRGENAAVIERYNTMLEG